MIKITDKTLSCKDMAALDDADLSAFLELLILTEVDAIELSESVYKRLSPLPQFPAYALRISKAGAINSMKPRRYVLDSTLRDGEQMPGICFTSAQKLKIAELLDLGGVHQIEAGVPAMSKNEKQLLHKVMENRRNAVISVWSRLVPSDIRHALDVEPDIIYVSVPVSYPHIYSRLRKNKTWVIKQIHECMELVAAKEYAVRQGTRWEQFLIIQR